MAIWKVPLLLICVVTASPAFAADGGATFDAFYQSAWTINYGLAAIVALAIGVFVFIGAPVLGPFITPAITALGTSIGGLFGLSGIASTNFGLALLGGGSIASGGFGILGGTALLAAALTFSTEVALDYSIGKLSTAYDAMIFQQASRQMMTLPLPRNTSTPESVEAAGKVLSPSPTDGVWPCIKQSPDGIDAFKGCLDARQRPQSERVKAAIAEMERFRPTPSMSLESAERKSAMLALLHFLDNDYAKANVAARDAYSYGLKAMHAPTLPSFIQSISMLYDEKPNFADSFKRFEYAIIAEPDNALTPLLFAAYLDRFSYRLNDGSATIADLHRLDALAQSLPDDERKLAIQQTHLAHYLRQLKLAQQKVLSLTESETLSIRKNPRTIKVVQSALKDYGQTLLIGNEMVKRQETLLGQLKRDSSWWNQVKAWGKSFTSKEDTTLLEEITRSLKEFEKVLIKYRSGHIALTQSVTRYENLYEEIQSARKKATSNDQDESDEAPGSIPKLVHPVWPMEPI